MLRSFKKTLLSTLGLAQYRLDNLTINIGT